VVGFILGEAERFVEFESLKAMLETIDRSFLDHAFYMAEGRLKADYPRMRAIGRSVQPAFIEHPA